VPGGATSTEARAESAEGSGNGDRTERRNRVRRHVETPSRNDPGDHEAGEKRLTRRTA
jgi:hypothetical protein